MNQIGGVDVGTMNNSLCYFRNGLFELIKDDRGLTTIPAVISFDIDKIKYGKEAKENAYFKPSASEVKRFLGCHSDLVDFEANDCTGYQLSRNEDGKYYLKFHIDEQENIEGFIYPEAVVALMLRDLVNRAADIEYYISDVVITVPATYSLNRIHSVLEAAKLAGLNVLRIVHEPCAAAYAFCQQNNNIDFRRALVFDLGGGTFDLSVIDNNEKGISIHSATGNGSLGGRNLDMRMAQKISQEIKNYDPGNNRFWLLRQKAEQAKIQLSSTESYDFVYKTGGVFNETQHLDIHRSDFVNWCEDLLDQTIDDCDAFFKDHNTSVDHVILVGGSSQIPYIQEQLRNKGMIIPHILEPMSIVAKGAAMIASNEVGQFTPTPDITIQYSYLYPIWISGESANDTNKTLIFHGNQCIINWSNTLSDIPLSDDKRIYVYTLENGKQICIGFFQLPDQPISFYTFTITKNYELQLSLSNNESTIGELLQIQYFKDCPEDFKKNFMLVNEFMDFLKSLKKSIVNTSCKNKEKVIKRCTDYLSFETFYRLCATPNDMKHIQEKLKEYKEKYSTFII